ncbi:MAG: hypothetical protein L6R28_13350 [Planctomycetes bacterium]|nr:hypothetical protein [Planctomycetota bacterium]
MRNPTMKAPGQIKGSQGTRSFTERRCLRCRLRFPSLSKANRICVRCAGKKKFVG